MILDTHYLLKELEGVRVDEIPLIEALKKTPRSGKAVRIDQFGLKLPKRSVYDHIQALPEQARFCFAMSPVELPFEELCNLLIFHDLAEALIGDVPCFTPKEMAKETYMSEEEKEEAEKAANLKLLVALPFGLKPSFARSLEHLQDKQGLMYRFYRMVDKLDPILGIWNYLYQFREIEIEPFLEAMNDFFLYPETRNACIDKKILKLATFLQTPEHAKSYFLKRKGFFKHHFEEEIATPLQRLIEREMHCV